jgi:hypothetical protein
MNDRHSDVRQYLACYGRDLQNLFAQEQTRLHVLTNHNSSHTCKFIIPVKWLTIGTGGGEVVTLMCECGKERSRKSCYERKF